MRWDDLRIFLAAYRAGSCAAASARLGLSHSTVSRRLDDLEGALGARLFDRGPDGLVALELAEEILPLAEAVETGVRDIPAVVCRLEERPAGRVRVALPDMMASELIAPALPTLLARYPGLVVELLTGPSVVDLGLHEVDLALRLVRPAKGDLVAKQVARLRFGVFGHRGYLQRNRGCDPSRLRWVDWDTTQPNFPGSPWLRQVLPDVEPALRTSTLATRLQALNAGVGVGVVAWSLGSRYGLHPLCGLPDPPAISVWLVCRRLLRRVPRVKVVWDFLLEQGRSLTDRGMEGASA